MGFGLGIGRVLGLELGGRGFATLGLALEGLVFPEFGFEMGLGLGKEIGLGLEIEVCLGLEVGLGLVLEMGMGFRFVMG